MKMCATYVIVFALFAAAASGNEPNDTLSTASDIDLDFPGIATIDGYLGDGEHPLHDVDFYRFVVPPEMEAAIVGAETSGDAEDDNLDTYLRIFDSNGTELASNDDRVHPSSFSKTGTWLLEPGDYFVGVSHAANPGYLPFEITQGGEGESGPYSLHMFIDATSIPNSPFEMNDTEFQAALMEDSFVVKGEFIGDGQHGRRDVDIYRVEIVEPTKLDVRVVEVGWPYSLEPAVVAWDDRGVLALGGQLVSTFGAVGLSWAVVETGSIYIAVTGGTSNLDFEPTIAGSGRVGTVGFYDLFVDLSPLETSAGPREPQDSLLTSHQLPPLTNLPDRPDTYSIFGTVGDGPFTAVRGDRDMFDLAVFVKDSLLSVEVVPTPGSLLDPLLSIHDIDGIRLASAGFSGPPGAARIVLPVPCAAFIGTEPTVFIAVGGNEHAITADPFLPNATHRSTRDTRLTSQESSQGDYELTVSVATEPPSCRQEPNDTLGEAFDTGLINEGTWFCREGRPDFEDPCVEATSPDYFRFTVNRTPARLHVERWQECEVPFVNETYLHLFDSAGERLDLATDQIDRLITDPGVYVVAVSGVPFTDFDTSEPCSLGADYDPYALLVQLSPGFTSAGDTGTSGFRLLAPDSISVEPANPSSEAFFATEPDQIIRWWPDSGQVVPMMDADEKFGGTEGIAVSSQALFVLGTGWFPTLSKYDLDTLELVGSVKLTQGSGLFSDLTIVANRLAVLDLQRQSVQYLTLDMESLGEVPIGRNNAVRLSGTLAALDEPSRLYASGPINENVVHEFDLAGRYIRSIDTPFGTPWALAGDGESALFYAVRGHKGLLHRVDRSGQVLADLEIDASVRSLASMAHDLVVLDFNGDGSVDLADAAGMQRCFQAELASNPECVLGDGNRDGAINSLDVSAFPVLLTGP